MISTESAEKSSPQPEMWSILSNSILLNQIAIDLHREGKMGPNRKQSGD